MVVGERTPEAAVVEAEGEESESGPDEIGEGQVGQKRKASVRIWYGVSVLV